MTKEEGAGGSRLELGVLGLTGRRHVQVLAWRLLVGVAKEIVGMLFVSEEDVSARVGERCKANAAGVWCRARARFGLVDIMG